MLISALLYVVGGRAAQVGLSVPSLLLAWFLGRMPWEIDLSGKE